MSTPGFSVERTYNEYGEIDSADFGAYRYEVTRDASGCIMTKTDETSGTANTRDHGTNQTVQSDVTNIECYQHEV